MTQDLFMGVDVAKNWLDIHHPHRKPDRITNTPTAIRKFITTGNRDGAWVIFEATGGYDHALRNALERSDRTSLRSARSKFRSEMRNDFDSDLTAAHVAALFG